MKHSVKRRTSDSLNAVQAGNRAWWTDHTMSYDWNNRVQCDRLSLEWFDEIDRRFIHDARLYGHETNSFDRIIPFAKLTDARVLEIGCGMGLHSELMARAGANITAIDISPTSVEATHRRAQIKELSIDVRQMDAVNLEFANETFDFVWSWGAIHHSSQTGRIIKEIHRVLKPGGETRVMVYNLHGMPAYVTIVTKYLLGFWRGRGLDECLWSSTDGFTARFYTPDLVADAFGTFFEDTRVETLGQAADAIPLPRYLRNPIVRLISVHRLAQLAHTRGAFLFVTAVKPAT